MNSQDAKVVKKDDEAMATTKMLKTTKGKYLKAEDAQDEFLDASEEDPKKPNKTTGKRASTKASVAEGTPIPDEDDDEAKGAAKERIKAAVQDEAWEDGH